MPMTISSSSALTPIISQRTGSQGKCLRDQKRKSNVIDGILYTPGGCGVWKAHKCNVLSEGIEMTAIKYCGTKPTVFMVW